MNTFGQLAPECAEVYFLYGEALLECGINQNRILGGEAAKSAVDLEEAQSGGGKMGKMIHFEGEPDLYEEEQEEEEEEQEEEEKGDDEREEKAKDDERGEENAEDDDDDDFSVAWQVLDLARLIYTDMPDEENQLKLSAVYFMLGDISMETENFEQALKDYNECLALRCKYLSPSNRLLAEIYYKLCMAYEYSGEKENAISSVTHSIKVLHMRRDELLKSSAEGKGKEKMEEDDKVEREIKDLNDLLPDLEMKLEDLQQQQQTEVESRKEEESKVQLPTNDLTSLVKKKVVEKRKLEQEEEQVQ